VHVDFTKIRFDILPLALRRALARCFRGFAHFGVVPPSKFGIPQVSSISDRDASGQQAMIADLRE